MAASKTAGVYDALREDILNGSHAPGAKLAIDGLARHFGVSSGAVREALSRLTSDRLVLAMPQRGFAVAEVSAEDLADLTDVRIDIETRCLRRSIQLGGLEWEARLLASWHRLSHVAGQAPGRSHPEWERLHATFHDDLVSACDSLWWLRLRDVLYIQAERYRRMLLPQVGRLRDVEAEHREIFELAMRRDAEGAAAALARHLGRTAEHIRAAGLPRAASSQAGRELQGRE
jgi:DNA-binding GntR family transcriptional regulator